MHQTTLIRRKVLTDRISKTKPNLGRFLRDIWKSWERQGKSCLAHRPEQKALTQSKPSTRPSSQFKPLFLLTLLPKCAIQQTVVFHQRAQPSSMGGDQAEPWSHTTTIFQTEAISLSPETERNRESYGAISHCWEEGTSATSPVGGALKQHLQAWSLITNNPWILETVKGYRFEIIKTPPFNFPIPEIQIPL